MFITLVRKNMAYKTLSVFWSLPTGLQISFSGLHSRMQTLWHQALPLAVPSSLLSYLIQTHPSEFNLNALTRVVFPTPLDEMTPSVLCSSGPYISFKACTTINIYECVFISLVRMFSIASERNVTKARLHGVNIIQYLGISENLNKQYRNQVTSRDFGFWK